MCARGAMRRGAVLLPLFLTCHGQLLDAILPDFAKTSRTVLDSLTKSSFVSGPSLATANFVASSVDSLTSIPNQLARSLGVGLQVPSFNNDKNIGDSFDTFDLSAGLGPEDAYLDIRSLVRKYGYQLEEHQVSTEDGFILTMFRIPGNGSAVLLQHGLMGSADDFVVGGTDSGLAYLLSRDGYDVWMGNARGNKHSRRHARLRPSEAAFWDFSWHEIGVHDLPAMIDYVLDSTGSTELKYVGHSQGTTAFFVMASERPEYNEKISLMVALSPVAFMSHVRSPVVRLMAPGGPFIHALLKTVGMYEFLPDSNLLKSMKVVVCGLGPVSDLVCSNVLFMMAGVGYAQLNLTNLPVVMGHCPSGASTKQLVHYAQGIVSGEFQQFDHGSEENMRRYGAPSPPHYQLRRVSAPVALFYSDADWLSHPADVDLLYNSLDNAVDIHKVPSEQFNHLDFVWAKDFKSLIYARLIKLFKYF